MFTMVLRFCDYEINYIEVSTFGVPFVLGIWGLGLIDGLIWVCTCGLPACIVGVFHVNNYIVVFLFLACCMCLLQHIYDNYLVFAFSEKENIYLQNMYSWKGRC